MPSAPLFEPGDLFAFPPHPNEGPDEDELEALLADEEAERAAAKDSARLGKVKDNTDTAKAEAEEKRQRTEGAARRRAAMLAAITEDEPIEAVETQPSQYQSLRESRPEARPESQREFEPEFMFDLDERAYSPRSSLTSERRSPSPTRVLFDAAGRPMRAVRAATASGSTVQFKRRIKPRAPVDMIHAGQREAIDLLATPLHVLKAQADELRSAEKSREGRAETSTPGIRKGLWVDKYRPTKFSDLLGEDRVHRDVMTWLKEWDKCVFKRAAPKKRKIDESTNTFYHDPLGRPRERILLLSGPPGYGKTTLAHVVANHAGYRTLEINASDDRNAATVTTRIQNAIDAGAGINSDRPTCVIIDEIDGATGGGDHGFVRSLIKLIQDVPAKKKTKTAARPLRRPIICICNDLYAPALRPLRQHARIVRFHKSPSQFLVERLRFICDRERLKADLRVLTLLVDLAGADVRSCLNTLQFIKSRSPVLTADAVKSSSVGVKDAGTTLSTVWNALFVPMGAKQRRKEMGAADDGRYVDRLAFMLQACGDYDRVVQGCFEHYTHLKPLDTSFANMCRLHDWVGYFDHLSSHIGENMEFELMAYLPYAIVPWYSHFSAPSNAKRPIEWPKADYEAYLVRVGNEEIAESFKAAITPNLRSLFSSSTTLTELIPLLVRIISPPLKPVNANIVKASERAVLARLVELLIPLGLRFWQDKTEEGQPQMRLEPAIDVFVTYDGKRAGDIVASRFAVRQLVAQAMDGEIARRRGQGSTATSTAEALAEQYGAAKTGAKDKAEEPAAAPTDFFGRIRMPPTVGKAGADGDDVTVPGPGCSPSRPPSWIPGYRLLRSRPAPALSLPQ
ncbi:hypothetical protein CspeluHIS016_0900570 [Cutaneotrichosporon spelunceum]|uniref:AAA+ ATPase domain-containing protein n=1 Tax=Cutaneotrichosporon spelunceum TaxID=1672016 RepID=A0AAD3YE28_9TREE|nr:hypothetical protein CspeluHIS016_0900570 [Cutaneotrichosporon spelunceum]